MLKFRNLEHLLFISTELLAYDWDETNFILKFFVAKVVEKHIYGQFIFIMLCSFLTLIQAAGSVYDFRNFEQVELHNALSIEKI